VQEKPAILISGGAGYIGSHTAFALAQSGYTPVVVDSLVTGHAWAAKFGPFREGDVGNEAFIAAVCREFRPVALIHFAAFIEVGESVKNPNKYFDNNTVKASRLFDTVLAHGVKHTVFSSTAAVYGAVKNGAPIVEDEPQNPINPYGESKLRAEKYLRGLGAKGMTSVALRYFNASGAGPDDAGIGEAHWPESHLTPNAILAATVPGRRLSIFGTDYPTPDGTAVRDYVHVMDLADAHIRALDYLRRGGASEICNLGTGKGNSVFEVITAVERLAGKPVARDIGPRREGDAAVLVADYARAQKLLGWKPQRDLAAIVDSALRWHVSAQYRQFLKGKL
jgi:UDP-glucose-4-epimerase GalE